MSVVQSIVFCKADGYATTEEAALRNSQVLALQRPPRRVHEAFESHFWHRDTNKPFPSLAGVSKNIYADRDKLMTLAPRLGEDYLTSFLRSTFPSLWRRHRQEYEDVISMSEYRLKVTVWTINVITPAGLLFGAIFTLYYVTNDQARLGILAAYTMVFLLCVALLSNASRGEIFGTAAAYAAVLVVFVSGGLGVGGGGGGGGRRATRSC